MLYILFQIDGDIFVNSYLGGGGGGGATSIFLLRGCPILHNIKNQYWPHVGIYMVPIWENYMRPTWVLQLGSTWDQHECSMWVSFGPNIEFATYTVEAHVILYKIDLISVSSFRMVLRNLFYRDDSLTS